jgi:hypothetical protein
VALPCTHTSAQTTDEPAVSSEREAERLRIQQAALDLVWRTGEDRDREVRDLRKYASGAAREYLDSQIAWIVRIECGDPRVLYETALRLRDGDSLPQHRRAARTWFERSGDQGAPEGFLAAARMRLDEPDTVLNRIIVEDLLKRAARKGVVAAQKDLGMRLIAAGPQIGGYYRGYHWLLLAQVNGADVDTGALAEASESFSAEEHLAAGLKVEMAVGKNLSTIWPFRGVISEEEKWVEKLNAALAWGECGRVPAVLEGERSFYLRAIATRNLDGAIRPERMPF